MSNPWREQERTGQDPWQRVNEPEDRISLRITLLCVLAAAFAGWVIGMLV